MLSCQSTKLEKQLNETQSRNLSLIIKGYTAKRAITDVEATAFDWIQI